MAADKKIFKEIEGIFGWIEEKKRGGKGKNGNQTLNSKLQLGEFFEFLGVEGITKEELDALHDLAVMKREKHQKRDKHSDGKTREYVDEKSLFSYKDLLRVFIPDEELTEKQIETDMEKEKKELMNAFRILTPTKSGDTIEISRLKKMLFLYEKQYTGQVVKTDQEGKPIEKPEKLNQDEINLRNDRAIEIIDKILSDLKLEGNGDDVFNFKEYLDNQFKTRK